jgi:hexosaminidase
VQVTAGNGKPGKDVTIELSNQSGIGDIRYTVDGSDVTATSMRYSKALNLTAADELVAATFLGERQMSQMIRRNVGQAARHRASHELELCSEKLVLSLEDDAPIEGDRSVFLIDVMNPCWMWRNAELGGVTHLQAAVGQVPFNFQIGADRDSIELLEPNTPAGELEVRANGCDGGTVAALPLRDAAGSNAVTVLSTELLNQPPGTTDLCFRFAGDELDPMWAIDWIELVHAAEPPRSEP